MPTTALLDDLAAVAQAGIDIPHPAVLAKYLTRCPAMLRSLISVSHRVVGALGGDARLSLELHRDREIDDQYLVLYVRQRDYSSDILERIERLSAELKPELDSPDGWLLITTDFQLPR